MTDRLGHKQTAALLTLMALAREVSNPELETVVGFRLDGKYRRELNDLNLVDSHKQRRYFVHELTDAGWAWCADELNAQTPPPPHGSLSGALYVVLAGLDGYLRRQRLSLADLFTPETEPTPDEIENRIRAAYRELAGSPRDWVGTGRPAPSCWATHPRSAVDAVLKD